MKKIITVDGPAGSGKSTISKLLANRIGYSYLDTGAIYRAITFHFLGKGVASKDLKEIQEGLKELQVEISADGKLLLNDQDVTLSIRTPEVTKEVPLFAQVSAIREYVKLCQKRIAQNEYCVVDGRDIGSVVFKDAFCKFYLDASPRVRAERRLSDDKESNGDKSLEEMEKEITQRDEQDKNRKDSPLVIPVDALLIDTSDLKVEEILEKMVEYYNRCLSLISDVTTPSGGSSRMFLDALEKMKEIEYKQGDILRVKITDIKGDRIFLDSDGKKDVVIEGDEVVRQKDKLKPGEEIDVYVLYASPRENEVRVSYEEALKRKALVSITEKFNGSKLVQGRIDRFNRSGFWVDVEGLSCFCSFEEYDSRPSFGRKEQLDLVKDFKIKSIHGGNVELSRKELVERERSEHLHQFLSRVRVGDILEGEVSAILKSGIFVTLSEGVGSVVRYRDISWKHFDKIEEVVSKGDKIRVRLLDVDEERGRLILSKKEAEEDPFTDFLEKHAVGDVLKGVVRGFESFGAFVQFEEGVEGLLHVSEISWTKKVEHPSEELALGQEITVKIVEIDPERRRISLGFKQIQENPWDKVKEKYPTNSMVSGVAKKVDRAFVIFKVDDLIDGFLHASDQSWTDPRVDMRKHYTVGETYELKVLEFVKSKKQLRLGAKQSTDNPWSDLRRNYGEGAVVKAMVVKLLDNGAVVKLKDSPLEGFCHISQASRNKVEQIHDVFEEGKEYDFILQKIDEKEKRIVFNAKAYHIQQERGEVEKYINQTAPRTVSLSDIFDLSQGKRRED